MQGFVCRMKPRRGQRFNNINPDDVFLADVQRPLDSVTSSSGGEPLPFEEHRQLCNAVLDGSVDVLRSLLVDHGLDVNARSSTGQTAGHQVTSTANYLTSLSIHVSDSRQPTRAGGGTKRMKQKAGIKTDVGYVCSTCIYIDTDRAQRPKQLRQPNPTPLNPTPAVHATYVHCQGPKM